MSLSVGQTWDGSALAAWTVQAHADDEAGARVQQVEIARRTALQLTCFDGDNTLGDGKARTQLHSPWDIIQPQQEYVLNFDVLIPQGGLTKQWANDGLHWLEWLQVAYGAPFAGSPALRFMTLDGARMGLREGDSMTFPWQTAAGVPWRGIWWHFTVWWRHSTSATDGFYKLEGYKAGDPNATLVPRKSYATILPSHNGGGNGLVLDAYQSASPGPCQAASACFANVKLLRSA